MTSIKRSRAVFLGPNESLFIDFTPTNGRFLKMNHQYTCTRYIVRGLYWRFVYFLLEQEEVETPLRLRKMIFQSVKQAARKKNLRAPDRSRIHNPLAPVVHKVESAIHLINHYPMGNSIGFPNSYPLDGDLSGG